MVKPAFSKQTWQMLGDYVGIGKQKKSDAITDLDSLASFIDSRASHVAQTSLYGYLRTRAGTKYPQLFENPDILQSINMAKWHIWMACVSDLTVFIGQLASQASIQQDQITAMMSSCLDKILQQTGLPAEAGEDFQNSIDRLNQRVHSYDWSKQRDDDSVFSQSPEALYYWSPIAAELKESDEEIVRNSIRFRWIDVRRHSRRLLNVEALFRVNA
ncbi:MAG: esterase [Gammaproteobacteria bacterium]|nr:esterase [Gammaproteobacteria bacterium]